MKSLLALALASLVGSAVGAPTVVIYRCVGADGQVTIQNGAKCPKGSHEQKRVVETPTSTPARAVVAPPPAPVTPVVPVAPQPVVDATNATVASSTPPAAAPAAALPAPAIYVCLTPDAQRYYSEAEASSRCAPLNTVGLDGYSATNADSCEMVEDHCEAVPDAGRCAAWAERRQRAVQALTFSPEEIDQARAELAHVDAMIAKTTCAQ
ncbi:hypothetical protein [Lysobacter claricitrinus]|uniref:hypothetical protein n=1 Tax=Lysobacter claricitrinus TaxID=3367728 RepID=UPI0037DA7A3E